MRIKKTELRHQQSSTSLELKPPHLPTAMRAQIKPHKTHPLGGPGTFTQVIFHLRAAIIDEQCYSLSKQFHEKAFQNDTGEVQILNLDQGTRLKISFKLLIQVIKREKPSLEVKQEARMFVVNEPVSQNLHLTWY